jgi:hypothetical protein
MSQKYAGYNSNGAITGFYDSGISPVPSGVNAIPISDADWQTCVESQACTVQNGQLIVVQPQPKN